jgi:cytochrome P450
VIEVDLLDPDLHASGRALDELDRARALHPIAWTRGRRGRGYWSVTGLRELVSIARVPATFTSWWGTRPEVLRPENARRPLHNLDPPEHGALRRIAEAAIEPLPSARARANAFFASGGGDVVAGLALPLCAELFGQWLRVDGDEVVARVTAVHEAGAALLDDRTGENVDRARRATEDVTAFFRRALGDTKHGPLAVIRDQARDEHEAIMLAALFAEAGLPTLLDAIGSVAFDLVEHPNVLPGPGLVDELLRRASPIVQFARRATRDVVIDGVRIDEGQQLVLWFLAANHDPRSFAEPRALVADRKTNPHVAFGYGIHRCIGARIARAVIDELVEEWRPMSLVESPVRRRSSYLRGFSRLVLSRGA